MEGVLTYGGLLGVYMGYVKCLLNASASNSSPSNSSPSNFSHANCSHFARAYILQPSHLLPDFSVMRRCVYDASAL